MNWIVTEGKGAFSRPPEGVLYASMYVAINYRKDPAPAIMRLQKDLVKIQSLLTLTGCQLPDNLSG
jgi:hypothetical protein